MTAVPLFRLRPVGRSSRRALEGPADAVHRWTFLTGVLAVLTAGATWGAWILLRIGFAGKFTGVSVHDINAHGQAQIYGWMGLFILGFAYWAFPQFWHTRLAWPRAAAWVVGGMIAGTLLRSLAMPAAGLWPFAPHLSVLGCLLQVAAAVTFALQISATRRRCLMRGSISAEFIGRALFFFVAMSALDAFHTWATMTAPSREDLLWQIATWQAPLRDLQVHGLALHMILGVCLHLLTPAFGAPPCPAPRARRGLNLLTAGVLLECTIFLVYRFTNVHWAAAFLMIPWFMIAAAILHVVLPWKLWRQLPRGGEARKFIRTAYAWLAASIAMLLFLPAHHLLTHIPFSHAYYGSIRHAITVGFVSQMIMAMARHAAASRLAPGTPRSQLVGPYILINTGCFLRVTLQTLTDAHPIFFALVGISGMLEVTALAWWGGDLVRMLFFPRAAKATAAITA
jgi:hypothetical protein